VTNEVDAKVVEAYANVGKVDEAYVFDTVPAAWAKVLEAYAYVGYAAMVAKVEVPYAKLGNVVEAYVLVTYPERRFAVEVAITFPFASTARRLEARPSPRASAVTDVVASVEVERTVKVCAPRFTLAVPPVYGM